MKQSCALRTMRLILWKRWNCSWHTSKACDRRVGLRLSRELRDWCNIKRWIRFIFFQPTLDNQRVMTLAELGFIARH